MTKKKVNSNIDFSDLNFWLGASGYTYHSSEKELDTFEKIYSKYESRIDNEIIDYALITTDELKIEPKVININKEVDQSEISELRMAARKGDSELSEELLNKLKEKHKKDGLDSDGD